MQHFTFDLHEGVDGRTYVHMDVRTYVGMVDDVKAIKPNFLALMGYQYFLSYSSWCTQSSAIISALKTSQLLASSEYHQGKKKNC